MKASLIRNIIFFLSFIPFILKAQSSGDSETNFSYYRISEAEYIVNDSTISLDNWINKGMNMLFVPVRDSLIISIDIGDRDKIFFMGMAEKIDNPGFVTLGTGAEFYHWIFVSHIKEGIRNAYILKEYIEGSLEKLGKRHYFINIVFADQTEFQFYGYELQPSLNNRLN